MNWFIRLFFKEGPQPRLWIFAIPLMSAGGAVYLLIHFIRKYW